MKPSKVPVTSPDPAIEHACNVCHQEIRIISHKRGLVPLAAGGSQVTFRKSPFEVAAGSGIAALASFSVSLPLYIGKNCETTFPDVYTLAYLLSLYNSQNIPTLDSTVASGV